MHGLAVNAPDAARLPASGDQIGGTEEASLVAVLSSHIAEREVSLAHTRGQKKTWRFDARNETERYFCSNRSKRKACCSPMK